MCWEFAQTLVYIGSPWQGPVLEVAGCASEQTNCRDKDRLTGCPPQRPTAPARSAGPLDREREASAQP
ncbi:unnamed protein product [Arctogadus glacialis]